MASPFGSIDRGRWNQGRRYESLWRRTPRCTVKGIKWLMTRSLAQHHSHLLDHSVLLTPGPRSCNLAPIALFCITYALNQIHSDQALRHCW